MNEIRFTPIAAAMMAATLPMMFLLGSGGIAFAQAGTAAVAQQPAVFHWQLQVEPLPEIGGIPEKSATALTQTGVKVRVDRNQLMLEGQDSFEQLQTALFDTASLDFLGGPVELTLSLPAAGTPVTLKLQARNTAGYQWEVVPGKPGEPALYAQSGEAVFAMRSRGFGAPAIQTIELKPTGQGNAVVHLRYQRSFEANTPVHAKLAVSIPTVRDVELIDPTPVELISETDFRASHSSAEPSPYAQLLPKALPSSWDWRTQGIIPEVRDQGFCNGCWSFGTVGAMEPAIKKGGGPLTDLSEQFLISCNKDGWGCDGGLTANKYHYDVLAKNQTVVGAVLESASPYTASNGSCATDYAHPYTLSGWAFITSSEFTMPTNDQLKNAIYTYGPITAGVCVDDGWGSYTGGVYASSSNICKGGTNHQIVLVGWDDATSSWILRNSWGPNWGENGYMRIAWDPSGVTSRVGEGTSWVKYQSATLTTPTLYSPSGSITTQKPAYSWSRVDKAASYKLQVTDMEAKVYQVNTTVSGSYCNATTNRCSYTPRISLTNNKNYQWRVAADGSAFSGWMAFITPRRVRF